MPVPEGVLTSTENFDQTTATVEEVVDDLSELQDSGNAEQPESDESSRA